MAGAVSRKLGVTSRGKAAFPFTVNSSPAGNGSLADSDSNSARGEIWLPLWTKPMALPETKSLFSEGRAQVAGRQSRTAVDFARAVAGYGVDRGISSFSRQGFLQRNGLAFLATPLGRFDVRARRQVDLLREIDPWLERFRRACGDNTPARFTSAFRAIERAIFDYCRYGGRKFFQAILVALGAAEREVATGESFRKNRQTGATNVAPLVISSPDWIAAAADDTPEFDLALALAGIRRDTDKVGPLRANLNSSTGKLVTLLGLKKIARSFGTPPTCPSTSPASSNVV